MKKSKSVILYLLFFFCLIGTQQLVAQTAPENIDYTAGVGGDFSSNPSATFAIAISPDINFPAVPAAAEFNVIMFIPTSQVTGSETFSILDNTTGGAILYQGSFAHTDGNTYFSFVYNGSGINLSSYGSGTFQLAFSVEVTNGNASASWNIADSTTGLFTSFGSRSALNVLGFNELKLVASAPPLPVELLDFQAELIKEQTLLVWQTASEHDNDYFSIERSKDGQHFEEIDMVAGAGFSNKELEYRTWDKQPLRGVNYYRLKQVDFDGTFAYSDIRTVELKAIQEDLSLFPNPTSGDLNFDQELSGEIVIRNSLGQLVWQQEAEFLNFINLSFLSGGTYWLELIDKYDQRQTLRFIISKN